MEWFYDGRPGQFIDPPPLSDQKTRCTLSSNEEFVQIYGLMVLKETLHINETSWSTTISSGTSSSIGDVKPIIHTLSDICKRWHRIDCNRDHTSITKLHLSNMNMRSNIINGNLATLSGSIPAEIAALQSLEHLEFYDNYNLVGQLPSTLSTLSELKYLYLHHTSIEGSVPAWLGSLQSLTEIFLEDTNLVGAIPSDLCELRASSLINFHADCGGKNPRIKCDYPQCCTACYEHKNQS